MALAGSREAKPASGTTCRRDTHMHLNRKAATACGILAAASVAVLPILASPAFADSSCTSTAGTSLSDCGFETPALPAGSYEYGALGSWTGTGAIASNNSAFTFSQVAPEGTQVGVVQMTSSISQAVSGFQAGETYTLSFEVAQRLYGCAPVNNEPGCNPEDFQLLLDGQSVGAFLTAGGTYVPMSASFSTTNGTHTITFQGVDTAGTDNSAFIDAVSLTSTPTVPSNTAACKQGGWQSLRTASDSTFKNQGDCVSYVASGGHSDPHS